MSTRREFRRVTFGRKLDVKRLRSALSQTMREMAKDPAPEAAPARLESVLIQPNETTVYLSGNGAGLNAVAAAVGSRFSGAKVARARRVDVMRPPADLRSRRRK